MSTPDSTLLLVGLTGTGKTTFLVALDAVLDNQTDPNGLQHADLAPDRGYLQPLKEQWLRGDVLERTNRQQPPPPHQLLLAHSASGKTIGLSIPDLAGETFDAHVATRSIPWDLWERINKADGVLLFVHCNQNADHTLLEHPGLMDESQEAVAHAAPGVSSNEWRIEDACQQVKLVDLLQFISDRSATAKRLRVAVMISAWDLVENAHHKQLPVSKELPESPKEFLANRWPLLKQFLDTNDEHFECRVYGVSARGGENSEAESIRLTSLDYASERVILVDGDHRSHDLTRPIRWILGIQERAGSPNV